MMSVDYRPPIRILLVDEHRLVLEGIKMLLGNGSHIDVVGECRSLDEAVDMIGMTKPDIVLLDVAVGKQSCIERLPYIKEACPAARILFLASEMNEQTSEDALQAGAHGLVLKDSPSETLLRAVKKVHSGEVWFERKLTSRMLIRSREREREDETDQLKIRSLTKRELEVTRLIAAGLVNKTIAERLFISEKTVRNHLTIIFSKIGVSNRLELALFASRNKLIAS